MGTVTLSHFASWVTSKVHTEISGNVPPLPVSLKRFPRARCLCDLAVPAAAHVDGSSTLPFIAESEV